MKNFTLCQIFLEMYVCCMYVVLIEAKKANESNAAILLFCSKSVLLTLLYLSLVLFILILKSSLWNWRGATDRKQD